MKKIFIIGVAMLCSFPLFAQVTRARLQASGLTCAMCAKSVYKNLEALPFVDKIDTDLDKSAFMISFKPGTEADADQIRKKVEDAGFSVAGLTLVAQFEAQGLKNEQHLKIGGTFYHFVSVKDQVLQGEKEFSVVEKNYLSAKDFKKYAGSTATQCFKTGVAAGCCSGSGVPDSARIYHVTL
jgi:copper chaperone CopZ